LLGRAVRVDLPEDVLLAPIDPVLLEQVFINLLENAARYAPAGTPIEVRAQGEEDAVGVEIADRGPGIPAGSEERIFEKFYRAADGERTVGTGLGLAVCRAIVTAHGGSIWAENRPGGGASFRFTLPCGGQRPPAVDDALLPEEPAQ
jgi:two-component system sensor histidine kinase KdpD